MLDNKLIEKLLQMAQGARKNAFVPYSTFPVGAALLTEDGSMFSGCNVENASYSMALCAETVAIGSMVAQGHRKIKALLLMGHEDILCTPCGACRQRINEFASPDTPIYLCTQQGLQKTVTASELLPFAFNADSMS